MDNQEWRGEFAVTADTVFFNHAAVSPLPRRACLAGHEVFAERWRRASKDYMRWIGLVAEARDRAARLLGAAAADVAFTGNTSCGLSLVAAGLDWKPGDRVAVTWPDFPSVRFPFDNLARLGVTVVEIPRRDGAVDMEAAARLIPGCRLAVASTVDWMTGAALDCAAFVRLCRESGTLSCFDAIQSLGALPFDATALGVDFVAAGCHKWQLGPMGLGIFYVAPAAAPALATVLAGWRSMRDEETLGETFCLKEGAGRFEPGTQDITAIAAYGESLALLEEVGAAGVAQRIFAVTRGLAEGLAERGLTVVSPRGAGQCSGILSFAHPDPSGLFAHLDAAGVAASPRGGRIRLSPHFYNDHSDVARFFTILDAFDRR